MVDNQSPTLVWVVTRVLPLQTLTICDPWGRPTANYTTAVKKVNAKKDDSADAVSVELGMRQEVQDGNFIVGVQNEKIILGEVPPWCPEPSD